MSNDRHLSWLQVVVLFVLTALVFVMMRWDKESWLDQQLHDFVSQQQLPMSWQQLNFSGTELTLEQVQWTDPRSQQTIQLAQVTASPVWGDWLQAKAAVHLETEWMQQPMSLNLVQNDAYTELNEIQVQMDLGQVVQMLPVDTSMLSELSGQAVMQGSVKLDASGLPVDGVLNVSVGAAEIAAMGVKLTLADTTVDLQHQQDGKWLWLAGAHGGVDLKANGFVYINQPDPMNWSVEGDVGIQVTEQSPVLISTMIRSISPEGVKFKLSGPLVNVRLQQI